MKIKGTTVTLYTTTITGTDGFGNPITTPTAVTVNNVLWQPTTATDVIDTTRLNTEKELLTLAIPKGDTHTWLHNLVLVNGHNYKCYAEQEGMAENIPLDWNKKVFVERYE